MDLLGALAGGLGGGILGGLAEAFKPQFQMPGAGQLEQQYASLAGYGLGQAKNIYGLGAPSTQGIMGGYQSLADLYGKYMATGGMPTGQDISAGQSYATSMTRQQAVDIDQAYQEQLQQARQQAALSGRSMNDPILMARLGRERSQSLERLGAQRQGIAAQFAESLQGKRLGYAEGQASSLANIFNVQNTLRQQELQNALTLGSTGMSGQQLLWQQRYNEAATKYGSAPNIGTGIMTGFGMGLGGARSIAEMLDPESFSSGNNQSGSKK